MAGGTCPVCKKRYNSVTDVFVEFCEKTATRGLPRAVRETSTVWKLIWFLSVLAMFCFAVSQISILMMQFFRYEVIQRETTNSDSHYQFPSVTVCNLSPIKSTSNVSNIDPTIPSHLYTLQNYYIYLENLKKKNPDAAKYLDAIRSTRGFYHNIPKSKQYLYGHNALDLVNYCTIRMSNGFSSYYSKNCSIITITQSPLFYNCFTVDMSNSESERAVTLSIILYLDESSYPLDLKYTQKEDIFGFSLGAKIAIHEASTYPDISRATAKISPGVSAWIDLTAKKWIKLGEPFEPCLDAETKANIKIENTGILFNYTKIGCRMSCLQNFLASRCECLEPSWPMTNLQLESFPFCMNVTDNVADFQERMRCRENIEYFDPYCNSNCHSKCKHYGFGQQLSSATWPHVSTQLAFYEQHIKGQSYGKKFAIYEDLLTYAKGINVSGNATAQEYLYKELNKHDLINRNFLQINIHRNFELRVITEMPAYAMQQLLSGIGGIFSLTIGITIITVVELLELCYRFVLYFCFYPKWTKTSSRAKDACACPPDVEVTDSPPSYGSILNNEKELSK